MKLLRNALLVAVGTAVIAPGLHISLAAQEVSSDELVHPSPDSWPGYHGDYSGRRHSHLTQITPANVQDLGLAWAFQTGKDGSIKSSPLVVNGVLYFTMPDNVWAVDARSGHMIWHYTYPPTRATISVSAGSLSTRTGFSFLDPTGTSSRSTQTMEPCAGTSW